MTASEPADAPPEVRDELGRRLHGLRAAVRSARGRIDDAVLDGADGLSERAGERLNLSGDHTIVALAGATGSGKSSLFNVLTDMELAGVGVRRPTTSWALACAWGPDGAGELLEWMGIPARHQVSRMGMLERSDDTPLEGLILLDLPDHDSTEVSHHVEMDRLVAHSDMLIWVLDPQKYADAAIHERYIRRMAGFGAVTLVVLNQIDRIPSEQRAEAIADVKRLIEADGLPDVKVLGVSAHRGDGVEDLRRELADRTAQKSAAKARLLADVSDAADAIAEAGGSGQVPEVTIEARRRFDDAVADHAGVPHAVDTMASTSRERIVRRTRWPVLSLFSRPQRSAVAELGDVPSGAIDPAVRDLVDEVTQGLKLPWRASVRRAVQAGGETTTQSLTAAIRDSGVRVDRTPRWSRAVQIVQWLLLLAAVAGLVWLGLLGLKRWADVDAGLPDLGAPAGVATAGWVAGGALIAGLALDLISRAVAGSSARRSARRADETLRAAIGEVTTQHVVAPIEAELVEYAAYRGGLLTAQS